MIYNQIFPFIDLIFSSGEKKHEASVHPYTPRVFTVMGWALTLVTCIIITHFSGKLDGPDPPTWDDNPLRNWFGGNSICTYLDFSPANDFGTLAIAATGYWNYVYETTYLMLLREFWASGKISKTEYRIFQGLHIMLVLAYMAFLRTYVVSPSENLGGHLAPWVLVILTQPSAIIRDFYLYNKLNTSPTQSFKIFYIIYVFIFVAFALPMATAMFLGAIQVKHDIWLITMQGDDYFLGVHCQTAEVVYFFLYCFQLVTGYFDDTMPNLKLTIEVGGNTEETKLMQQSLENKYVE